MPFFSSNFSERVMTMTNQNVNVNLADDDDDDDNAVVVFTGDFRVPAGTVLFKKTWKQNGGSFKSYHTDAEFTGPAVKFDKAPHVAGDNRYLAMDGATDEMKAMIKVLDAKRRISGTPGKSFKNGQINKLVNEMDKLTKLIVQYKSCIEDETAQKMLKFLADPMTALSDALLKVEREKKGNVFTF